MADLIAALIPVVLFLSIYSSLYRDNIFFKFSEHTIVGIAVGLELVGGYRTIYSVGVTPILRGTVGGIDMLVLLIGIILGIMTLSRFSKPFRYVANLPLTVLVGVGLGLAVRGALVGQIVDQIRATMIPITTPIMMKNVNNFIVILGTISVVLYFIFTREHTGALGVFAKTGRYFIMVAMGATLGQGAVGNFSRVTDAALQMFSPPGLYLTTLVVIIIAVDAIRLKQKGAMKEDTT